MNAITSLTAPTPCTPAWRLPLDIATQFDAHDWAKRTLNMEKVIAYLRSAFPRSTQEHVSAITGISPKTIRNWLEHISRPSGEHLAVLIGVFGPRFLECVYETSPEWVAEAARRERLAEIEAQKQQLEAEQQQLLAG